MRENEAVKSGLQALGFQSLYPRDLLFAIAAILLLVAGTKAMAIEEPTYEVVKTFAEFELRRYPAYLVAETDVGGPFDEVGTQAFRILADYIFGNNRAQTKIEMTAPVSQRPSAAEGERIEMTAPVVQRPMSGTDADAFVVSFVMPARFTLDTLPEPIDPRVRLREEPGALVAARRYSGRWTETSYRENETRLLRAIEDAGLKAIAVPGYARYNSPFSLWFMRRNEVMVEVEEAPD
jgi:hypothetical protein